MKIICDFCETSSDDVLLGKFHQLGMYTFHSNCIVFSSGIVQAKDRRKGINGFEEKSIKKELLRGKSQICYICEKRGATINCCEKSCEFSFHFPCGLKKKKSLHLYFYKYQSYCDKHISYCVFCCDSIVGIVSDRVILLGCCKRINSHPDCLKKYVKMAKGSSRCPTCQDKQNFRRHMKTNAIVIPNEEAEYALPINMAYDVQCVAEICQSPGPEGRYVHIERDKYFDLVLCSDCGSDAIHRVCGQVKKRDWKCYGCSPISQNVRRSFSQNKFLLNGNTKLVGGKDIEKRYPGFGRSFSIVYLPPLKFDDE